MAGTTPIYGLRYAELADPPDGSALGKNLADDVETELDRIDTAAAGTDARVTDLEADAAAVPQRVAAGVAVLNYNGASSTSTTIAFPAAWATLGGTVCITVTHADDPGFSRFRTNAGGISTAGATVSGTFTAGATPAGYSANAYWIAVLIP